jgi:hypothetical protein
MTQGATQDGRTSEPEKRRRRVRLTRDSILFALGCSILLHETLISQLERPQTLLVGLALAGGPMFLRLDESRARRQPGDDDDSPASTQSQPAPPPPPVPPSSSSECSVTD